MQEAVVEGGRQISMKWQGRCYSFTQLQLVLKIYFLSIKSPFFKIFLCIERRSTLTLNLLLSPHFHRDFCHYEKVKVWKYFQWGYINVVDPSNSIQKKEFGLAFKKNQDLLWNGNAWDATFNILILAAECVRPSLISCK